MGAELRFGSVKPSRDLWYVAGRLVQPPLMRQGFNGSAHVGKRQGAYGFTGRLQGVRRAFKLFHLSLLRCLLHRVYVLPCVFQVVGNEFGQEGGIITYRGPERVKCGRVKRGVAHCARGESIRGANSMCGPHTPLFSTASRAP